MKIRAMPNFREVAENAVASSVYHPLVMKNSIFGAENMSFVLANATHEFLLKGFAESILDMLKPSSLTGEDSSAFFQMADITDGLRKLPFVVALQSVYQKLLFKKPWNHQVMSNIFGGFGILYVSNVGDRMWYADEGKTPAYTYP
jgi:hypothetical protein